MIWKVKQPGSRPQQELYY